MQKCVLDVKVLEIEKVLAAFKNGTPIILFDDPKREGEADIAIHAKFCTPERVRMLRKDAGGMICLCTDMLMAQKLGVEFFADLIRKFEEGSYSKLAIEKTAYGDSPSFSTYINSRKVYTGISDDDRSMTIREFEKMISKNEENMTDEFVESFYAPGHVPLLISRGIENRRGHTEMVVELCKRAELSPAVVICEMLGDDGKALSWEGAREYAKKNGFLAIEGKEIF